MAAIQFQPPSARIMALFLAISQTQSTLARKEADFLATVQSASPTARKVADFLVSVRELCRTLSQHGNAAGKNTSPPHKASLSFICLGLSTRTTHSMDMRR